MKTGEHTNVEDKLPEGVSKPPAKRPRLLKSEEGAELNENKDGAPAVVINVDAMVYVMEFLPPRSLYNIASTCKSLRSKVTTKMVVQSALTQGGRSRKIMEDLHELTRKHSIHVPSPLRLLRLANAKRCEFCNKKSNVRSIYFGLGVYTCEMCYNGADPSTSRPSTGEYEFNKFSKQAFFARQQNRQEQRQQRDGLTDCLFRGTSHRQKNHPVLVHPRVSPNGSDVRYWRRHRTDASGEMIGPLVTATEVHDLFEVFTRLQAEYSSTATNESEEDTASFPGHDEWIADYLTNNLHQPAKEDYAEFNECVTSSIQMADHAKKERQERQLAKRIIARKALIPRVRKMMDEFIPLIDEPLRECAMKRHECDIDHFLRYSSPLFSLRTKFLNDWLEPYIVKPGRMTKKARKEMSEKINLQLHRIKKLWEMDFLSDEDEFQSAAKAYFRKWFPTVEAIFTETSKRRTRYSNCRRRYGGDSRLDSNFLEFMEKGRYLGALCHLINYEQMGLLLLMTEPSASCWREKAQHLDENSMRNLARKAWRFAGEENRIQFESDWFMLKRKEDDSWIADVMDSGHKYLCAALTEEAR